MAVADECIRLVAAPTLRRIVKQRMFEIERTRTKLNTDIFVRMGSCLQENDQLAATTSERQREMDLILFGIDAAKDKCSRQEKVGGCGSNARAKPVFSERSWDYQKATF